MKKGWPIFFVVVLLGFTGKARAFIPVHDPLRAIQLGLEITKELNHFKDELNQFKKEIEYITKKNEFGKEELSWKERQIQLFELIQKKMISNMDMVDFFRRRVANKYDWSPIRVQDIQEILNSPVFVNVGQADPYQAMFTQGTEVERVFRDIRYREDILQSETYQNNPIFKEYQDRVMQEEERLIRDVEQRKNLLAKISGMQLDSEKKIKKLETILMKTATMIENPVTQEGKYGEIAHFLSWNSEMNLEISRELLQQILVKKVQVEHSLLKKIRDIYREKMDWEQEAASDSGENNRRDQETVLNLLSNQ